MPAIYYSPSKRGFFHEGISSTIPEDGVKVSRAQFDKMLELQASGARIEPGKGGKPRAVISVVKSGDRRDLLCHAIKREARRRIEAISPLWQQMNDLRLPSAAGDARFARIDAVRNASDAIEAELRKAASADLPTFPIREHGLWPQET